MSSKVSPSNSLPRSLSTNDRRSQILSGQRLSYSPPKPMELVSTKNTTMFTITIPSANLITAAVSMQGHQGNRLELRKSRRRSSAMKGYSLQESPIPLDHLKKQLQKAQSELSHYLETPVIVTPSDQRNMDVFHPLRPSEWKHLRFELTFYDNLGFVCLHDVNWENLLNEIGTGVESAGNIKAEQLRGEVRKQYLERVARKRERG